MLLHHFSVKISMTIISLLHIMEGVEFLFFLSASESHLLALKVVCAYTCVIVLLLVARALCVKQRGKF